MGEKWLVIDAHNHYLPKDATELACVADGMDYAASLKRIPVGYEAAYDIENRIKLMDDAGVDMTVLEQSAWSPQGIAVCKAMTDGYADAAKKYPDRFIPCAHLPLQPGQEVLDELDRAVNELGFKVLSLVSSTSKYTLDSEDLFPLYEKVNALDIPIFVHPSIKSGIWGGSKHGLSNHVSREYDVAKATVEVMYGVLPRFPELKFIMPHHGGGIPSQKGRMMAWHEPEDWQVPDNIKGMPKTPVELEELGLDKDFEDLWGKLYFDTAGFGGWMPITEAATKTIMIERLCFGTDYPFEIHNARDVKAFIDNIKALDIPEQDKKNILGENIKRLFKL
ncbi:MAG: amidohydrolase [Deltaproteobacteria bacterium]|nr:amidohydrolase [Deltaproteobacteria bacterium]